MAHAMPRINTWTQCDEPNAPDHDGVIESRGRFDDR
jgi:hypothetical protein